MSTIHKKISHILIVTLLVSMFGLWGGPLTPTTFAIGETAPLRILEIKDLDKPSSGEASTVISDLASKLGSDTRFQLETMSIKKFVALRDELDGKYDAIYFGKSLFNPTSETGNNHNTRYEENDITTLKANEIKDKYITKGLPVIVYSDSSQRRGALYQGYLNNGTYTSKTGNLYNLFSPYNSASVQSSVIFVNEADIGSSTAFLTKTKLLTNPTNRPRLNVTNKPYDYTLTANRTQKYIAGNTLTYNFDVLNVSNLAQRNLVANLYLGIDSVLKFDATKLVQSVPVTALTNNTISFTLPKGYSGLYYWRLELVDQTSTGKLKDASSGVFRYQDQAPTINVLQVLPNSQSANKTSSLALETNLKQNYLHSDDYQINITVTDFNKFNSTDYSTLNGKYDMVIFGFNDSYNQTGDISSTAAAAVKSFIATGQGVMFTHDTVYQGNQTWITNFQAATGQIGPMTNMGLNAPHTSTSTVKVNEGLLTEFPFFISEMTPQVATTHDQYFRLNLNDPDVIPWYNINGSARDIEDSWNHYYTYSKGNVTYSGTGHNFVNTSVNSTFPDWEQKLFVNTMYRAFIGSNHKPTLEIISPVAFNSTTSNYLSANSDISVSFKPDDLDLNDKKVTSSIKFKYKDILGANQVVTVLPDTETSKGETITRSFTNPLATSGGDLTISVSTRDVSGAQETKEVAVKVITSTSLTPERTISTDKIEVNNPVTVNYSIKPSAKTYSAATNVSDLMISGLHFKETFPANLELVSYPTNLTASGTLATGFTLEGDITSIPYRREGNLFVADNTNFTIVVKPKSAGDYSLSNANLTYNNFASSSQNVLFSNKVFTAFIKLTSLSLDNLIIAKGDTSKLIPKIMPSNATYKKNEDFTWFSDATSIVTVNASGEINGLAAGTANITATATDGSGLVATSVVSVIQPGLNITGPTQVAVDSSISLTAALVTANENVTSVSWRSSDTSIATIATSGSNNSISFIGVLNGHSKGTVTVTATVTTDKGRTYTKDYTVAVFIPVSSVAIGNKTIRVGEVSPLTPNYLPSNADFPSFTWSSARTDLVSVDANGSITGKAVGTTQVTVRSTDGSNRAGSATITVMQPTLAINGPNIVNIGDKITLEAVLTTVNEQISTIRWLPDAQDKASFVTDGDTKRILTGILAGTVNGQVKVTTDKGNEYTQTFNVTVKAVPIESITLTSGIIRINETKLLIPAILPANASNKTLNWSSSNDNIATVDQNGNVTGVNTGESTITATAKDGSNISGIAQIKVMQPTLKIERPAPILQVGHSMTLTGILTTVNEIVQTDSITWEPDNQDHAKFRYSDDEDPYKRIITGIAPGVMNTSFAVKTDKGNPYTASTSVTVFSLSLPDSNLDKGETAQLSPIINPVGIIPSDFYWASSDSSIVTVDATGKIAALQLGSATITIVSKTNASLSASGVITVIDPTVEIITPEGNLGVNGVSSLLVGETIELKASFVSTNQRATSVNWSINDPNSAVTVTTGSDNFTREFEGMRVDPTTGKYVVTGTVIVTTDKGKTYTSHFTINITNPVREVSIVGTPDVINVGDYVNLKAVITRPDAFKGKDGFQWFILTDDPEATGGATFNTTASSDVRLTGTHKGKVIVKVLVGGKSTTKDIQINQVITGIFLPEGPITLIVDSTNQNDRQTDLWTPLTVVPSSLKDEVKGQLNWTTSTPSIVDIVDGVVKALKVGTTTVTVTDSTNSSITDSVQIIVEEKKKYQNKY